ncbi:hypothetical protein BGX34_000040 [Mortierella sp. NVP85]|nr:hypothetical protein BGX34_000040 [Mortierella sp. NVP85]
MSTYVMPSGGDPTATVPITVPTPTPSLSNDTKPELLCDWIRSAADCRDADFIRSLLITSSVMHGLAFLFAVWLLTYRNRGFNRKIVTELFVKVGTGIRPKPMDCISFFSGIASLFKIAVNIPVILDVWKDKLWLRIAFEQFYWIIVAIGFSTYFVGLLYAMPVTTREGVFAIYQPETAYNSRPLPPIHVLTPTTAQKNFLLVMGAVYPAIGGFGVGVASAALAQMPGYENASRILLIIQYSNWVLILWAMALMFFYYGLKYTFILRANIIIAEAALKAPKAAFGISNLRSSSPARFLFIQLQITGFGGSAATLLAGSLCMIWVLRRDAILSMATEELPHTIAWFWTCAMTMAFFVIMGLIAVQSVRNRRRGLHEPATSLTNSQGPSSGQKSSTVVKSQIYSSANQKGRSSESEARQALRNSDLSTLNEMEKDQLGHISLDMHEPYDETMAVAAAMEASRRMDEDGFNSSHNANKLEQERAKKSSAGSRPFVIKANSAGQLDVSDPIYNRRGSDSPLLPGNRVPTDLRQTVFGRATSPPPRPTSPTGSCPSSPAFPMTAFRSGSRNSGGKFGTVSQFSQGSSSPPSHTTSFGTLTGSGRDSREIAAPQNDYQLDQQPYQSISYQGASKGLSPPPRAKRLATSPKDSTLPSSPVRATFLNAAPGYSAAYSSRMDDDS